MLLLKRGRADEPPFAPMRPGGGGFQGAVYVLSATLRGAQGLMECERGAWASSACAQLYKQAARAGAPLPPTSSSSSSKSSLPLPSRATLSTSLVSIVVVFFAVEAEPFLRSSASPSFFC